MSRSAAEDVLQTFLASISNLDQSKFYRLLQTVQIWIFFFLRIWLSHENKKSCCLFLILLDVGFALTINVSKQG